MNQIYHKARVSRDPRFDGKFFVAVKTTGIYCRTICPATTPKEENVTYYDTAMAAATAGYRPCLRCRPDSAPHSAAWKGVNTTLDRAINLIDQGALQEGSLEDLSTRLGISSRYLRQLFQQHLGVSPKAYELYQKCLFAKKLLHQTKLPVTQVAFASGFNSVRRFNDCFVSELNLTPTQVRSSGQEASGYINLELSYRPPYSWSFVRDFFTYRLIEGLEWCDEESYGRSFEWQGVKGSFHAQHDGEKYLFNVSITLSEVNQLKPIVSNIRRLLDLDLDMQYIDQNNAAHFADSFSYQKGLRIPGTWSVFEAGIRAILGQQVSVKAAHTLCAKLVDELGETLSDKRLFPTPQAIFESTLDFLKIPGARKATLKHLAQHYLTHPSPEEVCYWQTIKGVGPWTMQYAQLRGHSHPDIFLETDLVIKKVLQALEHPISPSLYAPWRSYLTLQLWNKI